MSHASHCLGFFCSDTPFKQQRLRAWQPILTPRTVLPTLFIVGLIFIPLGVGFFITSKQVNEITMDYTNCNDVKLPVLSTTNVPLNVKQWSYNSKTKACTLEFELLTTFQNNVFLYYRLTNFYQNHRRYVKSISSSQLKGEAVPYSELSNCEPLVGNVNSTKPYYPCGLIANSLFNDTIYPPKTADNKALAFSEQGIAWPTDIENFKTTAYKPEDILPPPSWKWIGDDYTQSSLTGLANNEHLMVWLRTAALPTFLKLYSHFSGNMEPGVYTLEIKYNYDVKSYGGTKSIVISTMSWLGGKNSFLGIAYMVVGSTCIALGTLFLIKNIISPRKLGDPAYLSWNQPTH